MSDVASSDFVRGGDGDGGAFGAEVALFLYDDDYAVAWRWRLEGVVVVRLVDGWMGGSTDFSGAFHFEDFDAFCYGCSGVVDDVHHGLLERM